MLEELQQIRFVAANFTQLQGLKTSLTGFFVLGVAIWSNNRQGDLLLPLLLLLLTVILFLVLERYYRRSFGRVRVEKQTRRRMILISLIFGVLGLIAFLIDTSEILPLSTVGIVFALGLWFDYIHLSRPVGVKFPAYLPWFALILLIISILPAFDMDAFWDRFGFAGANLGVLALVGVLLVISGLLGHLYLVRSLSPRLEASNDEPV